MRVKVLLADDHAVVADGLTSLLSPQCAVLGAASDGQELLKLAREKKPDVIILDISMPLVNGLDAIHQLRKEGCAAKFLVLSMHRDPSLILAAFKAGASGYVSKECSALELDLAVSTVSAGRQYLSRSLPINLETVRYELRRHHGNSRQPTGRQRQVLQLVAEGKTMKEIGGLLGISTRTVEFYKYTLMRSLGLRTNAQLVQHAIKLALVTVPPPIDSSRWR
ncbi:MAG TPA: response regulator transcription factor [Terriglobales bacterium]|nr:response regulator transcription factor [Terriglobales bacterium]